jgi:hypothetical protein
LSFDRVVISNVRRNKLTGWVKKESFSVSGVNFTNILLAQLRQYSCANKKSNLHCKHKKAPRETFVRKRRAQNVGDRRPSLFTVFLSVISVQKLPLSKSQSFNFTLVYVFLFVVQYMKNVSILPRITRKTCMSILVLYCNQTMLLTNTRLKQTNLVCREIFTIT